MYFKTSTTPREPLKLPDNLFSTSQQQPQVSTSGVAEWVKEVVRVGGGEGGGRREERGGLEWQRDLASNPIIGLPDLPQFHFAHN